MTESKRKYWGWGFVGEGLGDEEVQAAARRLAKRFGVDELAAEAAVPEVEDFALRASRVEPPASLASICTTDPWERLLHAYGKSYPDTVRIFQRSVPEPPDVVAYPRSETDILELLDWIEGKSGAAIPYGGGSSVVGGVEPAVGDAYAATLSIDLARLDQVLEVDAKSRTARIQAGARGPALEAQLKAHGYTLRHFPQSFEHSTLGGWIATRSGGHFATLYTHIDDFVESLRVVTPQGVVETRRLPGSGAGPSPDRLFIGSEGILGLITEAWMRVQDRPTQRAAAAVLFDDFLIGAEAVRQLSQSGLYPANCRLIDAQEAAGMGAGDGSAALLVLGFESADHPVTPWMQRGLEIAQDCGGRIEMPSGSGGSSHLQGAVGDWRRAFIRAPYLREHLVPRGVISDTFETAVTWDRFPEFHAEVTSTMERVLEEVTGRPGSVTCRFTHVYPDGPAPYFTLQALGRFGSLMEQWREIKLAANEVVVSGGGTVTHHHAVGRDHRPRGYDEQRPELFSAGLQAAKRALDPSGILNPGVLIDPQDRPLGTTGAMRG